ncbi:MAG: hypothetical protein ACI8QF_000951, partial [Limisphaerales bacterium]
VSCRWSGTVLPMDWYFSFLSLRFATASQAMVPVALRAPSTMA